MPDLRNDLPESDHDILVEIRGMVRAHEKEIDSLRSWRHDVVAPTMMAIQAQQKTNADHISKLSGNVEKVTAAVAALAPLPGDFREHMEQDRESFAKVDGSVSKLHEKIDRNREERAQGETRLSKERASGELHIVLWVAGIVGVALLGAIGAMWGILSPYLLHLPK